MPGSSPPPWILIRSWYWNLLAHPEATVHLRGKKIRVQARAAEPEVAEQLFARFVAMYHGYARYRKRTDRVFPVMLLRPLRPVESTRVS